MEKVCAQCGVGFGTSSKRARFCSDRCRIRSHRAKPGARVVPLAQPVKPAPAVVTTSGEPGAVEAATLAELVDAKRDGTALGQAALMLARKLDGAATDTGAGAAAVAKQLQVTLAAAVEGARTVADPVDELRLLRDRKRNAG